MPRLKGGAWSLWEFLPSFLAHHQRQGGGAAREACGKAPNLGHHQGQGEGEGGMQHLGRHQGKGEGERRYAARQGTWDAIRGREREVVACERKQDKAGYSGHSTLAQQPHPFPFLTLTQLTPAPHRVSPNPYIHFPHLFTHTLPFPARQCTHVVGDCAGPPLPPHPPRCDTPAVFSA